MHDTSDVHQTLSEIFTDENEIASHIKRIKDSAEHNVSVTEKKDCLEEMISILIEKTSWTQSELMNLVREKGLMLSSLLDEINEWAEDCYGDFLIEEDDNLFVKPGDVWLLGNNRLMCGDCRLKSDITTLMNGMQADLIVTDPPYNVAYTGGTEDELTIQNDSMDNDMFATFLRQVFGIMFACLKPGGSYYVFHADSEGENFRASLRKAGFKIAQCCVWVKNSMVMGRQDYQWQHEPCLYGWKPGASHKWYSDRKQTTTWFFDKPQRNSIHPTMKPIALMAYPICNSSAHGDIVLDIFSGSGSTLMACQQVDRICHALEIDPKYVVGTVNRYKAMFPEQPVKLYRDGVLLSVEETQNIIYHGQRITTSE